MKGRWRRGERRMDTKLIVCVVLTYLLVLSGKADGTTCTPSFNDVEPDTIGVAGGSLVTIHGNCFPQDLSKNFLNVFVKDFVELRKDGRGKKTRVKLDSVGGTTHITFLSPKFTDVNGEASYQLTMVLGEAGSRYTNPSVTLKVKEDLNVKLDLILPNSGAVDSAVQTLLYGDFKTDCFNSTTASSCASHITNIRAEMNDDTKPICPITSATTSKINCTLTPGAAGNYNFIVNVNVNGNSVPGRRTKAITTLGTSANFQVYSEITGIDASEGSMEGGKRVTLTGRGFGDVASTEVCITTGMTKGPCAKVMSVSSTEIVVEIPAVTEVPSSPKYAGGRGVLVCKLAYTSSLPGNLWDTDLSDKDCTITDSLTWRETSSRNQDIMMFEAAMIGRPSSLGLGNYVIGLKGDDEIKLQMLEDPADKNNQPVKASATDTKIDTWDNIAWTEEFSTTPNEWKAFRLALRNHNRGNRKAYSDVILTWKDTSAVKGPDSRHVKNEVLEVNVTSFTRGEEQTLECVGLPLYTEGSFTCTFVVTSEVVNIAFNFTLYWTISGNLSTSDSAAAIRAAINDICLLTFNEPDCVASDSSVVITQPTYPNGFQYRYQITSKLPFDKLVMASPTDGVLISKTADNSNQQADVLILELSGAPTSLIKNCNDINQVQTAVSSALTAFTKVDKILEKIRTKNIRHTTSFEPQQPWSGYDKKSLGIWSDCFSGRWCLKDPSVLWTDTSTDEDTNLEHETFTVCIAFRIEQYSKDINVSLTLKFSYIQSEDLAAVDFPLTPNGNRWNYSCHRPKEAAQNAGKSVFGSSVKLQEPREIGVKVVSNSVAASVYFDSLFVGIMADDVKAMLNSPAINQLRKPACAICHGIRSITLTRKENTASTSSYKLAIEPNNCFNKTPLVVFGNCQNVASDTNNTKWSCDGKNESSTEKYATVARQLQASPPITGTLDISGCQLLWNFTAEALKNCLEVKPGVGHVNVTIVKRTCSEVSVHVEYTSVAGTKPLLPVSTSRLSGWGIVATTNRVQGSEQMAYSMMGDMFALMHDVPQITLHTNGVPAKCSKNQKGQCPFQWSLAKTPNIASISTTEASCSAATTVTITGTKLTTTASGEQVMVKIISGTREAECTVTSQSETEVVCTVTCDHHGVHTIRLHNTYGYAAAAGIALNCACPLTAMTPTTGPYGGGYEVTVTGYGLSTCTVTLGGTMCHVTTSTSTVLKFVVPPKNGDDAQAVEVTCDGMLIPSNDAMTFTYTGSPTIAPTIITAINTTESTVGGVPILISSGDFGAQPAAAAAVTCAGCIHPTVQTWSSTQVEATLPPAAPGTYKLCLATSSGCADLITHNIADITVEVVNNGIEPKSASVLGGTFLTMTGKGFIPDHTSVILHETYKANINHVTATTVKFMFERNTVKHTVTLHIDEDRGRCAWSMPTVDMYQGDSLRIKWDFTTGISIIEVDISPELRIKEGGITYDNMTQGDKLITYRVPRRTCYMLVNEEEYLRHIGCFVCVNVNPLPDEDDMLVNVKVLGHLATVQASSARKRRSTSNSNSCPTTVSHSTACSSTAAVNSVNVKNSCTPKITYVSPCELYPNGEVTLTGTYLGDSPCAVEVKFKLNGKEYECRATSVTEVKIVCTIQHGYTMAAGSGYVLTGKVNNRGNIDTTGANCLTISIKPKVTGFSTNMGSPQGGSLVMATGFALTGVVLAVSNVPLTSPVSNFNQTQGRMMAQGNMNNQVVLRLLSSATTELPCTLDDNCTFTYNNSLTTTVTAVGPVEISGSSTTITLNGTNMCTDKSALGITVGGYVCQVTSSTIATETKTTCELTDIPAATGLAVQYTCTYGHAVVTAGTLTATANCGCISPTTGSIHGGTSISIACTGLTPPVAVQIGTDPPMTVQTSGGSVTFVTPAHVAGEVDVKVTVGSKVINVCKFTYAASLNITGTSPTTSDTCADTTLQITTEGTLPAASDITVTLTTATRNYSCPVTNVAGQVIDCDIPDVLPGTYGIVLHVKGIGYAANGTTIQCTCSVTQLGPTEGSCGGGHRITITGRSLSSGLSVEICDRSATVSSDETTLTSLLVDTPSNEDCGTETECDVKVTCDGTTHSVSNTYTYKSSLTPTATGILPRTGGTGGGTNITITGTGYGSTAIHAIVTVDDVPCEVQSVSDTQIICTLGQYNRTTTTSSSSRKKRATAACDTSLITIMPTSFLVILLKLYGRAVISSGTKFTYVDRWSSGFTWNHVKPIAGDLVVIPKNQIILLDEDTPILKMIIIQGGQLIFEDKDIHLQVEIILIAECGVLQIGTQSQPFQHKAKITLHGHLKSKELPIYGTKAIAVREGILDLHGKKVEVPWTVLDSTASMGSRDIVLMRAVDWKAGDTIVIATTGGRHSQKETEVHVIHSISADRKTITTVDTLAYKHLGESYTIPGTSRNIELRAEVALLTRTILIQGNNDLQWNDTITACAAGFNTGEFATQTCFQGRFGAEIGSNQFGGHILIHSPGPDHDVAVGRIEYVELFFMGQAFRLGRYPIHFHLLGIVAQSYVRGCAIYKAFNRAINIHASHNILVEWNIVYNIMGGALFLEDGVETGNIFQYNLVLFVIASSSLLNDDITPAAYWVTNPNNIHQHNHAAGGTHFGFWYRMHGHPDGPSFDANICPDKVPLGTFFNNTVHSCGWFGIWIFQNYFPRLGGSCTSNVEVAAVFQNLYAWHCEKGAEWVKVGPVQFVLFLTVCNLKAGIEGKFCITKEPFTDNGALISNSTFVASTPYCSQFTKLGVILPYGFFLSLKWNTFVNFNESGKAALGMTQIDGKTETFCGGYTYELLGTEKINTPNLVAFRWPHEGVIADLDGTFTGKSGGGEIVATEPLMSNCVQDAKYSVGAVGGSICDLERHIRRFAANKPEPASLEAKDIQFILINCTTGEYIQPLQNTTAPYKVKGMTHGKGWMALLLINRCYHLQFVHAEQLTNLSFNMAVYKLKPNDWIVFKTTTYIQSNDVRTSNSGGVQKNVIPSGPGFNNGDWFDDGIATGTHGKYFRVGGFATCPRSLCDAKFRFTSRNCPIPGCPKPVAPSVQRVIQTRPVTAIGTSTLNMATLLTTDGDIIVPDGQWWLYDTCFPRVRYLFIYGHLECVSCDKIEARNIIIGVLGGLVCGWSTAPYQSDFTITLFGNHASLASYKYAFDKDTHSSSASWGPVCGTKAICVCGRIYLHGKARSPSWTNLASTANAGTNSITLSVAVDWQVGEKIVIASTSFGPHQTEKATISAVSANRKTLTLTSNLQFTHLGVSGTGNQYAMRAEVALLNRNIKVTSDLSDTTLAGDMFGTRIIVGRCGKGGGKYAGDAQIVDIEFEASGQEGWVADYDPRYALTYLDTPVKVKGNCESYAKNNVFHDGFTPAVAIIGGECGEIISNVCEGCIRQAFLLYDSSGNTFKDNLAVNISWSGSRNRETSNLDIHAAMDLYHKVTNLVAVTGNVVAGCQRTGFHMPVYEATNFVKPANYPWANNIAHSCLCGLAFMPSQHPDIRVSIVYVAGFTFYNNYDYGVYVQVPVSIMIAEVTTVDNGLGIFTMVIGPPALSHRRGGKTSLIKDCIIIIRSPHFKPGNAVLSSSIYWYIRESSTARLFPGSRRVGLIFTVFSSGGNNAPKKPWAGIKAYNAIDGLMNVKDVTFSHNAALVANESPGNRAHAIATNPKNEDAQHPARFSGVTWVHRISNDNKVWYDRPSIGKIDPSDCVDMPCDAKLQSLIIDTDGSFLGTGYTSGGYVIPEAEFIWDSNPVYGVGTDRIPKDLLTKDDGSRIVVNTIAPHRGISRSETDCTLKNAWQAYVCKNTNLDYTPMVIESMDSDTETRRLSPVALLANGYIDLLNGPQDHGWCAGYTCQKRISTFHAVVRTGILYNLTFTSTTPQNLRLYFLNANTNQKMLICIYYTAPQRQDVYKNGVFVPPKNADQVTGTGTQKTTSYKTGHEDTFMPTLTDADGSNMFMRSYKLLCIVFQGSSVIDIKMTSLILISFQTPAVTVDEFFGPNLVKNLAAFLDIPKPRIRIVSVVSASSTPVGKRRRKRDAGLMEVTFEISTPPAETADELTPSSAEDTYLEMQQIQETIVSAIQLGNSTELLGEDVTATSFVLIVEPLPAPNTTEWEEIASPPTTTSTTTTTTAAPTTTTTTTTAAPPPTSGGGSTGQTTPTPTTTTNAPTTEAPPPTEPGEILIPHHMVVNQMLPAHEGVSFSTSPAIRMVDSQDQTVALLGTSTSPWRLGVTLRKSAGSDTQAGLIGGSVQPFKNGFVNFYSLGISHSGSGYYLDFQVVYPAAASSFRVSAGPFTVAERPLRLAGAAKSYDNTVNVPFTLTVMIQDAVTATTVSDLSWKGYNWTVYLYMDPAAKYQGALKGAGLKQFSNNGTIDLSLEFTSVGFTWLSAQVTTEPKSDYDLHFTTTKAFGIFCAWKDEQVDGVVKKVALQLANASITKLPEKDQLIFTSSIANLIASKYDSVTVLNFTLEVVETMVPSRKRRAMADNGTTDTPPEPTAYAVVYTAGSSSNVSAVLQDLKRKIDQGLTFDYKGITHHMAGVMLVDGETYTITKKASTGLSLGAILGIVFGMLALLLLLVVIIIACYMCNAADSKKRETKSVSQQNLMESNQSYQLKDYINSQDDERETTATPVFRMTSSPVEMDKLDVSVPGSMVPPRRLKPLFNDGNTDQEQGFVTTYLQPSPVIVTRPKVNNKKSKNKKEEPQWKDPNWFGWYEGKKDDDRPPSASSYRDLAEPSA